MLLWLISVCWARKLNTPKWDILATDVSVYFYSKLIYQSINPAKVREKPPDNAESRKHGVWRDGKFPSSTLLAENAAEIRRWTTFSDIYILDDRNSCNQVQAT